MKVTWIGHASFLVQCSPPAGSNERGINILLDPVFSDRTSPFSFIGPKRYTPPPCTLKELCERVPIDVVCISHNHYDHADAATLSYVFERAYRDGREMVVCVGLRNGRWVKPLVPAMGRVKVWEGDWWERCEVALGGRETDTEKGEGDGRMSTSTARSSKASASRQSTSTPSTTEKTLPRARITITPSQHASARSPFDRDHDLWCSFALELPPYRTTPGSTTGANLYFSGDTAYRTTFPSPTHPDIDVESLSPESRATYPHCPAFAQIGTHLGPFDLALLPIGLTRPRSFMSNVHADSVDSIQMFRDVKGKKAVGMHWGTVRGGISGQYEDVRLPPREWEGVAREGGFRWRGSRKDGEEDWEIGLLDVGEGLVV